MLTCRKFYKDIPFGHRQPNYDGPCAHIHGHNWTIELELGCSELDKNGFVMDFGQMEFIQDWIETHLDHAYVLNHNDPLRSQFEHIKPNPFKFYFVENCSCEGLAVHLAHIFHKKIQDATQKRVFLHTLCMHEDAKNSTRYVLNSKLIGG
jgi:6-pyruvoyltetrahydropterin/6-carboxytetrahydropterin synthase